MQRTINKSILLKKKNKQVFITLALIIDLGCLSTSLNPKQASKARQIIRVANLYIYVLNGAYKHEPILYVKKITRIVQFVLTSHTEFNIMTVD